jgi:DnaJ-class molecular chaperone
MVALSTTNLEFVKFHNVFHKLDIPQIFFGCKIKQIPYSHYMKAPTCSCGLCHKLFNARNGAALCDECRAAGRTVSDIVAACKPAPKFLCPVCKDYRSDRVNKKCERCEDRERSVKDRIRRLRTKGLAATEKFQRLR